MNARMCGWLLLLMCSYSISAHAEDESHADSRCVAAMSDEDVEQWLMFVDHSFAKQRLGASLWWSGWSAFNVFNVALGAERYAHADKRLARDNWLVSIIGAGLFLTEVSVLPMPGLYGYRRLSRLPASTPEQKRRKLLAGLKLLDKAAAVEKSNSDVWAHVAVLAYAVVSTGYVWIRNTDAPQSRLWLGHGLQFGTAMLFGEATLWTVPRRARRDRKLVEGVCRPQQTAEPSVRISLGPTHVGVHF
jgi:hypothetical protein